MVDFAVMPAGFDAAVDAADRQAGYMSSIRSYVDSHTNLGDMSGLVMACLGPMYESARNNAVNGLKDGESVARAVHTQTTETQTAYEDVDSGLGRGFNSIGTAMAGDYEAPSFTYGEGGLGPQTCVAVDPLQGPPGDSKTPLDTAPSIAKRWADRDLKGTPWETPYDKNSTLGSYADAMGETPFRDRYEERLLGDDPNRLEGVPSTADRWRDNAGAGTESAYAQGQRATYDYAGLDAPPPTSSWVDNHMTARTTRAAGTVYDLYNSTTGAYSAVQEYRAADARADRVSDLADGPATSRDNVDWAN